VLLSCIIPAAPPACMGRQKHSVTLWTNPPGSVVPNRSPFKQPFLGGIVLLFFSFVIFQIGSWALFYFFAWSWPQTISS
jgi:magnesium-transporting ATPase (P-type)